MYGLSLFDTLDVTPSETGRVGFFFLKWAALWQCIKDKEGKPLVQNSHLNSTLLYTV